MSGSTIAERHTTAPPQQKPVIPIRSPFAKTRPFSQPDLLDVGQGGQIDSGAIEEVRRDRDVAEPGEAAADVLDIVVDPENLVDDDDRGVATRRGGAGDIGRQRLRRAVGDQLLLDAQPFGGSDDRSRLGRHGRERVAGEEQAGGGAAGEVEILGLGPFGAGEMVHKRLPSAVAGTVGFGARRFKRQPPPSTTRHCEERSDEAIQPGPRPSWIASLPSQ
jgi:hypothetical protein